MMMFEAGQDSEEGVNIVGKRMRDVRFADGQAMIGNSEYGLQQTMNELNQKAENYGMKINIKKTKTIVISKEAGKILNIYVNGGKIDQVEGFKYLGSVITKEARCQKEIKHR